MTVAGTVTPSRPDVLALQEVHFDSGGNSRLVDEIAEATGLRHVAMMPLSPSHVRVPGEAGLGILSRYPILHTCRHLLSNPDLRTIRNGVELRSHDKGILVCTVDLPAGLIDIASLHIFPFHRFGRHAQEIEFKNVWRSLANGAMTLARPIVLAGDFNTPQRSLALRALPRKFTSAVGDLPTHNGKPIDDILYSTDLQPTQEVEIVPTFSDHHFCVTELTMVNQE